MSVISYREALNQAMSDPDRTDDMEKTLERFGECMRGYPVGAEMVLAVERGELDGRCGWAFPKASGASTIACSRWARRRSKSSATPSRPG